MIKKQNEQPCIPFTQWCFGPIEIGTVVQCFFLTIVTISHWRRCDRSFEQTWSPFTQGCFVSSLVEICLFFLFLHYLHFEKHVTLKLNNCETTFIQQCAVPSKVKIWRRSLVNLAMHFLFFAVTWLKYCRYGVYVIQSINQSILYL